MNNDNGARDGPPQTTSPLFAPGDTLASRYRINRFIARGGMGEVYEVEDNDLGIPVALKAMLPEIASNPKRLWRFKREVLLSRSVTRTEYISAKIAARRPA